jgi:release factor glutamine methyltransferase
MTTINIAALLQSCKLQIAKNSDIMGQNDSLNPNPNPNPNLNLDLEVLLAHVLGVDRSYLYTWPEREVTPLQQQTFESWVKRRLTGEPLAYIIGYKEFWSLNFKVSKAVLIPRPETELLVELILERFPSSAANTADIADAAETTVLDLGTGSGAIALALGFERPQWQIWAVDKSEAALAVAKENADSLNIKNVHFYQSDWFSNLGSSGFPSLAFKKIFNLIVANPPYLAPEDKHLVDTDIRFEPREALVSKPDGLEDCRQIIQNASAYLAESGWLMLEHGFDQAVAVMEIMQINGFIEVQNFKDLAGLDRVTLGRKSE